MPRRAEWYCDANAIGLGKQLASLRLPVTYPGDSGKRTSLRDHLPESPIQDSGMADELWIPIVTRAGLAVITRDNKILRRTSELNAVHAAGARLFVIDGTRPLDLWGQLRLVAAQWDRMVEARKAPGPFVFSIGASRLKRIDPW